MSIIKKLNLSQFEVENIVLEWYGNGMCTKTFYSNDIVNLRDYLVKSIKVGEEIKEYGNIDLINNLSNRIVRLLLSHFQTKINPELTYNDLYKFPIKYLMEIDYEELKETGKFGDKSVYEMKEFIRKLLASI